MPTKIEVGSFSSLTRPLVAAVPREFEQLPALLQAAELLGINETDLADALTALAPRSQVCSRARISHWRKRIRPIPLLWEARMAAYLSWLAQQLRHTYTEVLGDPLNPGIEEAEQRIFDRVKEDVRLADLALDARKILDRKMAAPSMQEEMKRFEKKILGEWKGHH
jgi:hypothetical protein